MSNFSSGIDKGLKYDLTDQSFGEWKVKEYAGNGKWICECSCGTIKEVVGKSLRYGKSTSCGHLRRVEIENKQFGNWLVLKQLNYDRCIARCLLCNTEHEVKIANLKSGSSTSCGCQKPSLRKPRLDLTGKDIGSWKVGDYIGDGYWSCTCICGEVKKVKGSELKRGKSKSCGCVNFTDLSGSYVGKIKVLKYKGYGTYECLCEYCGNIVDIDVHRLKYDKRDHCGCQKSIRSKNTMKIRYGDYSTNHIDSPRTQEQMDAISSKGKFREFIKNLGYKPTTYELSVSLGISADRVLKLSHKYNCEDIISLGNGSRLENEVCAILEGVLKINVKRHDRTILYPQEIDIYMENKKIGIEINGDYWHSEVFKDSYDSQNKTINALHKGVRLVHIFEYEWNTPETQVKLQQYLIDLLSNNHTIIGARETEVKEIDSKQAIEFCNKYHLQNGINARINIGCFYRDELIGVMMLSKPRYNTEFEYEIIRSCWKSNIRVTGGLNKLFNYFKNNYNPKSVITYIDISKFTGNSYTKIGFTVEKISLTKPNYVWVKHSKLIPEVLTRYQTQKHILVENGWGTEEETEKEIMEKHNYIRVYDCGNLRMTWYNKE